MSSKDDDYVQLLKFAEKVAESTIDAQTQEALRKEARAMLSWPWLPQSATKPQPISDDKDQCDRSEKHTDDPQLVERGYGFVCNERVWYRINGEAVRRNNVR